MAGVLDRTGQVQLDLRIELGRAHLEPAEAAQLAPGSVVALEKMSGDPVDIYVDGQLVARGQLLVLNETFCVRVTELTARGALSAAA